MTDALVAMSYVFDCFSAEVYGDPCMANSEDCDVFKRLRVA